MFGGGRGWRGEGGGLRTLKDILLGMQFLPEKQMKFEVPVMRRMAASASALLMTSKHTLLRPFSARCALLAGSGDAAAAAAALHSDAIRSHNTTAKRFLFSVTGGVIPLWPVCDGAEGLEAAPGAI
jgi:hypothetical protein